jgi:O-antigen/teichoic acid export membrane protein
LDHFSLELYRILVTKIKPREAVLFHFVRNVPFILILLLLDFFKIIKITLDYFIIFWLISNIISIQSLFIRNKVLKIFPSFISIFKNTFTSFVKLLNDSKFYFFLAIFGTITSNIDKFILVKTIGLSNLGIYFTLLSLAAVVNIFISYSIGAHQGPQIVKDFSLSGFDYYIQKRSILIRDYIFYSTGASFVVVTCFYFSNLFQLTNYKNYLLEMSFILISVLISSVSEAFKIDIYVAKFDKKLFFINIIISSFSIINLIYFSNYFGLLGATIALVINSFVQFILFFLISKSALKNLASTRNSLM